MASKTLWITFLRENCRQIARINVKPLDTSLLNFILANFCAYSRSLTCYHQHSPLSQKKICENRCMASRSVKVNKKNLRHQNGSLLEIFQNAFTEILKNSKKKIKKRKKESAMEISIYTKVEVGSFDGFIILIVFDGLIQTWANTWNWYNADCFPWQMILKCKLVNKNLLWQLPD